MQAVPRDINNIPYTDCSPIDKLSDVDESVEDVYFPISTFATDGVNWKSSFNLTEVLDLTLRPCGGLFYWIPTDTFTLLDSEGTTVVTDRDILSWDTLEIPEDSASSFPYIDEDTNEFVWADPSTQQMRAWMRANVDPNAVLLKVGTIDTPLAAGTYTVNVAQCRDLQSSKFIKLCTTEWIGGDQTFLAAIYFAVGGLIFLAAVLYMVLIR